MADRMASMMVQKRKRGKSRSSNDKMRNRFTIDRYDEEKKRASKTHS
jgi:hypothetical protein